jgi:hypothetical protein
MALNIQTHDNVKQLRQEHAKGIEQAEEEQKKQTDQANAIGTWSNKCNYQS